MQLQELSGVIVNFDSYYLRINDTHFPVTALGPGHRIGIWLQGCSRGCEGCIARDTWDNEAGDLVSVVSLLDWCKSLEPLGVDGITISGGEPLDQSVPLSALLLHLRSWIDQLPNTPDILCYTGYDLKTVISRFQNILPLLDAIITEPFVLDSSSSALRGSSNQEITILTSLGQSRYEEYLHSPLKPSQKLQVAIGEDENVKFIGIPQRGELEHLIKQYREQGITLSSFCQL